MTTITLSRLKDLGSIDNPQASAMERVLMHAIDSQPTDGSHGQITDADIAAFTAAFPGFGDALDAGEQDQLLAIFETASAGNAYNLALIAAARVPNMPVGTTTIGFATTDASGTIAQTTARPVMQQPAVGAVVKDSNHPAGTPAGMYVTSYTDGVA